MRGILIAIHIQSAPGCAISHYYTLTDWGEGATNTYLPVPIIKRIRPISHSGYRALSTYATYTRSWQLADSYLVAMGCVSALYDASLRSGYQSAVAQMMSTAGNLYYTYARGAITGRICLLHSTWAIRYIPLRIVAQTSNCSHIMQCVISIHIVSNHLR